MKKIVALLLAATALGGCVPRSTPPAPVPAPRMPPPPVAPPAPAVTPTPSAPAPVAGSAVAAWMDMPLTPGAWTYRGGGRGQSRALFGRPGAVSFEIACTGPGTVAITHANAQRGLLTVRTSSAARTVATQGAAGGVVAQLPAGDALLDAMAFSRGRFAVEAPGAAPLIIPAWPELARVVEDCRR